MAPPLHALSTMRSAPKFSFGGRPGGSRPSSPPGPGAYSPPASDSDRHAKSASFGFGTASRDQTRPSTAPGPGHYAPSDPRTVSAKHGFGTSIRKGIPSGHAPGPGAYDTSKDLGSTGPKYSVKHRRDGGRGTGTPGPGAYTSTEVTSHKEKKSAAWGFGTAPRDASRNAGHPGPGAYTHESSMTSGPKFSMRLRTEPPRKFDTPGPGAHESHHTQFG